MDPQPSKLEKNLDTLLAEMGALKQLKSEMQRQMGPKTKSWLQNVEAQEHVLDEIQRELEQLQTPGYIENKFIIRHNLNKRVIECVTVVKELKTPENVEVSRENVNDVETLISELEMLKPQRYSYDQLMNIITSDVIIGEGGFGEVYMGKIGKFEVAVKVLKEHKGNVMEKQFMNEMRTMYSTSHQHLVKLYGYCFEPKKKALVYEYMANKSLDKHLYKKSGELPWDKLYNIAIGTAKGIAHLHESYEKPIIHYDIKAANVLLDSNYFPKVTDFGLSKIYEKDVEQTRIGGTALYAAPEVSLGSKEITFKCDVFSFGLMLLEILRRKRIKKNEDCWFPLKVWESLQNGMLENLLLTCGIEKKDIKQAETFAIAGLWCIQFDPDKRPHMSNVVKVLEGEIQLPSDPPNPDTSCVFATAHGIDPLQARSTKSYKYDERSDEEVEGWRFKKDASTSNLNVPIKPRRKTVEKPLGSASTGAQLMAPNVPSTGALPQYVDQNVPSTTGPLSQYMLQNVQGRTNRRRNTNESSVPQTRAQNVPSTGPLSQYMLQNVQGRTNMSRNTNEFSVPQRRAQASPSIQYEHNQYGPHPGSHDIRSIRP